MYRGVIYKYTNKFNNKVYIGQTLNENKRRKKWRDLKSPYAGSYINRAREKWGVDAFEYSVLVIITGEDKNILRNTLNTLEVKYISIYDSRNSKFGYNLTLGGESGNGQIVSKATREKQRKIQTGKKKVMSDRGKRNISLAHRGPRPYRWKKVCQIDPNTNEVIKIWDSISQAVNSFGDSYVGNLTSAIKHKNGRKLYRNFKWKYYETDS